MRQRGFTAAAALMIAAAAWAQREGPLEVKTPRGRSAPVGARMPSAPAPCPAAGECIWSEVVVSSEGKVIEQTVYPPGYDPALAGAADRVKRFAEELPDFICEQLTWRFDSDTRPPRWRLRDRISAEVLYLEGRESYQNLRRNGKPIEYWRAEQTGTWSTGEFGTLLQDLFGAATAARFRFVRRAELDGRPALLYDFEVPQAGSHWRVDFEGRVIYPAYQGSLWLDPESSQVLRIEMQARDVPASYPMDVVEMTVDYGLMPIGGAWYLLPVRAANLACRRYSTYCTHNEITFTNYRRFVTESVITTTDSTVTYELPDPASAGAPRR